MKGISFGAILLGFTLGNIFSYFILDTEPSIVHLVIYLILTAGQIYKEIMEES